jgi:multicomponent Na+:H+ antiporter subunit B
MRVPFGSPALDTAVRAFTPFVLLFAAYVIAHGHTSPGGGFQGGVLAAAAIILIRLAHGTDAPWGLRAPQSLAVAAAGLLVYAGIGFLALPFGGRFLDHGALPLPLAPAQVRAVGTLGIEIGVGLTVMGVMVFLCDALMGWEEGA